MDSFDILVIVLSCLLAVFLALAIAALVIIIRLVRKIHLVTDKAMHAVESVESMADTVKNAAGTSVVGGIGMKLWKMFYRSQKKKRS